MISASRYIFSILVGLITAQIAVTAKVKTLSKTAPKSLNHCNTFNYH